MSWRRAKSPGWAAFDLKQRQKDCFDVEGDQEPYPPMSSAMTSCGPSYNAVQKNDLPVRSFSSVLLPAMQFPALPVDENHRRLSASISSSVTLSKKFIDERDIDQACTNFKELYSWADESLIEDIMGAVDYDVNKASALLAAMVSSEGTEQNEDKNITVSKSNSCSLENENSYVDTGTSCEESAAIEELSCTRQDGFNYSVGESSYDYMLHRNKDSDNTGTNLNLGHLKTIPIEPEWEENDIYLFHRKEAIKMMRSASQHSRAATDAYTRGDHFTAQQFSAKAREEWTAAERLNFKAAKEILSIWNNENGAWKLDLHGLHAAEAVQALQERLQKLESLVPSDRSISPKRNSRRAGIVRCASLESLSCTQKLYEEHASSLQRPTTLHVITGIGNHSRGQAALPTAIRNFLNENSYHYDEPRPGLITMRPKFRRQ